MAVTPFITVLVSAPAAGSVAAPATRLVEADQLNTLVYNSDPANTVYLSNSNYVTSADANSSGVSALPPLTAIAFDGSSDVYAVAAPGQTAKVQVFTGGSNWTPSILQITGPVTAVISGSVAISSIANPVTISSITSPVTIGSVSGSVAISSVAGNVNVNGVGGYVQPGQSTSLYNQGSTSGTPSAFNIAANSTSNPISLQAVSTYNSYDISLYIGDGNQATAGHAHCVNVEIRWYDDNTSGIPVFIEDWNVWCGKTIPMTNPLGAIIGTGPMHGLYMSVYLTNPGNAAVEVQWMVVYGSPRTQPLSDWRQNIQVPGIADSSAHIATGITGTSFDNTLCQGVFALAASQTYIIPFNMFSGPVNFWYQITNAAAFAGIFDIGSNYLNYTSGSLPTANASKGMLESNLPVQGGGSSAIASQLFLPRSACCLMITCSATASTLTLSVAAEQGP